MYNKDKNLSGEDVIDLWKSIHIERNLIKFPKGTWQGSEGVNNFKKLLKFIIEEYYKLEEEKILSLSNNWFKQNNLATPFSIFGNDSPYKCINMIYENKFKEFQMKVSCKSYWTKKTAKEALLYKVEKRKIDKNKIDKKLIASIGLTTPLNKLFNGSPKLYVEYCFKEGRNKFEARKERGFWDRKNAIEAFKYYVKKNKLKEEEIINLKKAWFIKNNLSTPLKKFYKNSPYIYIKEAFMKEHEFDFRRGRVYKGYWTKENTIERFIEIINSQGINPKEALNLNARWFGENGLKTPLKKFFNNSTKSFKYYLVENDKL